MLVSTLIEELKKAPPGAVAICRAEGDGGWDNIQGVEPGSNVTAIRFGGGSPFTDERSPPTRTYIDLTAQDRRKFHRGLVVVLLILLLALAVLFAGCGTMAGRCPVPGITPAGEAMNRQCLRDVAICAAYGDIAALLRESGATAADIEAVYEQCDAAMRGDR